MISLNKGNIVFGGCLILFTAHQYLQKIAGVHVPVLDNYLDPLLAMPILLHLVVLERKAILNIRAYWLPVTQITGYCILMAIIGEIIFPVLSPKFTGDILDVLLYGLGGIIHACSQKSQVIIT